MKITEIISEGWSQKYKKSINCSHPKGFSQKAHCAGKNKHNESVEMEMVCESCGMCQTHGNIMEIKKGAKDSNGYTKCWTGYHAAGTKKSATTGKQVRNCVPNESIEESQQRCKQCGMTNCSCKPGTCKCKPIAGWIPNKGFKKALDEDWNKVNKKDKTDGLSQKAVNAYRRENPGSKLKTAVTTKPSKLKAGSKDAKRRKSFCARMSGNKGPMKKPNGKPTPKALALRRWNCESVEEMVDMIIENMDHSKDNQAVPELKSALLAKKATLQTATDDQVYDIIDQIMTRIAKSHGISGQKLHDMWVKEYDQIPDTWIMK
jgi:hypothetical protein